MTGSLRTFRAEEERLAARLAAVRRSVSAYEAGAAGEHRLRELLAPLEWSGFRLLPDRGVPGRRTNIDMVAVGPGGVWVIDAKHWSGRLSLSGGSLLQNGRRRDDAVGSVGEQAFAIGDALAYAGVDTDFVPIVGSLCFTGPARIGRAVEVDGVLLVDAADVVPNLLGRPAVLSAEWIDAVAKWIDHEFAPRTDVTERRSDRGDARPPPEPVVFMVPWRKYGKYWIYVKDEEGRDGGVLDVRSGELRKVTSPVAGQVLEQLLRHETGDAGEEDAGLIARFLARLRATPPSPTVPLVVGRLWRGKGIARLYVHRLAGDGSQVQLGWFDLGDRRVHAEVRGEESTVRYCGATYLRIDAERG